MHRFWLSFNVHLTKIIFTNLSYYSAYFCYYLWVSLHFLVLFMDPTILSELTFTFIYYIIRNYVWAISLQQLSFIMHQFWLSFNVHLAKIIFTNLFYYSAYFCYYLWVLLHFLILFMSLTVLSQLTFTFIYSRVCFESTYFAETKNFLLKVL